MELSPPPLMNSQTIKILTQQLQKGHRAAHQLRQILINGLPTEDPQDDASEAAVDLVVKIISCFSNCISIVGGADSHHHQCPESEGGDNSPSGTAKTRRGCYKRRKTAQTKTIETSSFPNDGHSWRKYGNKTIMNAVYPRQYFKCTNKVDQGCLATRTVQKISHEPSIFRTVYIGEHTCQTDLKASPLLLGSSSLGDRSDSSLYLSFGGSSNHPSTSATDIYNYSPEDNNPNQSHHHHRAIRPNPLFSSPSSSASSILQSLGMVMSQPAGSDQLGLKSLVTDLQNDQSQSNKASMMNIITTQVMTEQQQQCASTATNDQILISSSNYNYLDPTVLLLDGMNIGLPFTPTINMDDDFGDVVSLEGTSYSCSTISSHSLEVDNFTMPGHSHSYADGIFNVDFD